MLHGNERLCAPCGRHTLGTEKLFPQRRGCGVCGGNARQKPYAAENTKGLRSGYADAGCMRNGRGVLQFLRGGSPCSCGRFNAQQAFSVFRGDIFDNYFERKDRFRPDSGGGSGFLREPVHYPSYLFQYGAYPVADRLCRRRTPWFAI